MAKVELLLRFEFEKLENASFLLKALVHPTRLAVIDLLDQNQEMNVGELADFLDVSHALISHHLIDMRNKDILKTRREGQLIYYSIKNEAVLSLLKCVSKL